MQNIYNVFEILSEILYMNTFRSFNLKVLFLQTQLFDSNNLPIILCLILNGHSLDTFSDGPDFILT